MLRRLFGVLLLLPGAAAAQSLTGSYVHDGPAGRVTLSLEQQGTALTGLMKGADGSVFRLEGALQEGAATGTIRSDEGAGWFAAGLVEGALKLIVAEVDPSTGVPDLTNGWEMDFRAGSEAEAPEIAAPASPPPPPRPGSPPAAGGVPEAGPGAGAGVPPQKEDTQLLREWLQHLRGMRLTYMNSYDSGGGSGGYSDRWEADLCSDGTFFYSSSSSLTVNVPGASAYQGGNRATRGIWRIVEQGGQVVLRYQMEGSEPEQGLLQYQEGTTYLGGNRVFVTADNASCR